MSAPRPWVESLASRFESAFPVEPCTWRTIGREAEFPVVNAAGEAGDVQAVLAEIAERCPSFEVSREGSLITEVSGPDYAFSAEVGTGTVEVILGVCDDLHEVKRRTEDAMGWLLPVCDSLGLRVLGMGTQPVSAPSTEIMTNKHRYGVLHEAIGDGWLWFTITASDQVHVDISRAEVSQVFSLVNLLAPVTVALCASSPFFSGSDSGECSVREGSMGKIDAAMARHGMIGGPVDDMADWVDRLCRMRFLMERRSGVNQVFDGTFAEWLEAAGGPEAEGSWDAFMLHDHYVWNSARPRYRQATMEVRAAGQQPWADHMVSAALGLGLVQAAPMLQAYMDSRLGEDAWRVMRAWHGTVVRDGLAAEPPVPGLIEGVLDRVRDGLVARGRGEERYLEPLFKRAAERRNPAQVYREQFSASGMDAVVASAAVRSATT